MHSHKGMVKISSKKNTLKNIATSVYSKVLIGFGPALEESWKLVVNRNIMDLKTGWSINL